jgi:hypothetical protein
MDETRLRRRIRNLITTGKLPDRAPERMWGGPGSGAVCILCGEPVIAGQTELELEFSVKEGDGQPAHHHSHARCFTLWELERQHPSRDLAHSDKQPPSMSAAREDRLAVSAPRSSGPHCRSDLPDAGAPGTIPSRERNPEDRRERE